MNFGIPAPLLFGMILMIASLSLFLTSKFKPELHQESDNIYAGIGVVCGLLLLTQLDLGIGMAFQQMLMIGAVITLMWQYVQVRAENKRLKGSGGGRNNSGREAGTRRSGYAAKIDEEPEYAPSVRSTARRLNSDRQDQWNNYDDEYDQPVRDNGRMLPEYRHADQVEDLPRRRGEYSDYEAPETPNYSRRSSTDNTERAQPPVDRQRRSRRSNNDEPAAPARNRRRSSIDDSADEPAAKSSAYVDYEPVDSVVPAVEDKPIQFPDQY